MQHTTRVTLYRDSERIELHNEITENFDDVRTWGFGFELTEPTYRHEEVGAILDALSSQPAAIMRTATLGTTGSRSTTLAT